MLLLVSCLPIPALGDTRGVTIEPGVPVNIEKLSGSISLLEDRDGSLNIAEVSSIPASDEFIPASPKSANVGFSESAWWARLIVRNRGDQPRFVYLRQDYPLIDLLDLYEPVAGGGWRKHATGDRTPFGTRDVAHRDFLFPLTVPASGEATYFLRYRSQGPIDISLSLADPTTTTAQVGREQLAYGVYFGCVIMLLVWSGLVFIAVRDGAFLAYFAYIAIFGVYMAVNTGLAYQYFWPESPWWGNTCLLVLLSLAVVAALQFSTTILRARDYTPRFNLAARGLQVLALCSIGLCPFVPYSILVQPITMLVMVAVVFMITLGIVTLLAGSRPARPYVIAWGAFLAGSMVFLLKNFGLLPHTFFTQHSWQVGSLLEMILLSMTLSSRMSELQHQSRTDALTLLGNRRLFDDRLRKEFAAANVEQHPLALLVLDIDKFKHYNDMHGHAQGDEAVKAVAHALRKHARKPHVACRYGGDEFCVILPTTSEASAAVLAERLRAAVQGSLTGEFTVTVSIGYACQAGGRFSTADQLFEAADAALYCAKEQGRNCTAPFEGRRNGDPPRVASLENSEAG